MRMLSPDAVNVSIQGDHCLAVCFSNGEKRIFDLTPLLGRKCYARLNDPRFLARVSVQNGCVTWPDDIDIDPDWLYEDSVAVSAASDAAESLKAC